MQNPPTPSAPPLTIENLLECFTNLTKPSNTADTRFQVKV